MKDHVDVYELIAATSSSLKKAVRKMGPGTKYPKPVAQIIEQLKDAHDCSSTIKVMEEFIHTNGR